MKHVYAIGLLILLMIAFGGPASAVISYDHNNASTHGDIWDAKPAGYVNDIVIHLKKGVTTVFYTTNLSAGGDPILYLLGPGASANGAVTTVAQDDDSGGNRNARLTYTPPQDGDYRLILTATGNQTGGTCTLMQDTTQLAGNIPFSGAFREYDGLRVGEVMTMVEQPNGLDNFQALYFFDAKGSLIRRHLPVNFMVSTQLESAYSQVFVLAAKSLALPTTGPIRIVRNDARLRGHDADGDGLGDELEAAIGTCSKVTDIVSSDWDCSQAADLKDTDGDGISDADELLGRMDVQPPLWLPMWGADPRHKDIFIEVDFSQATPFEPAAKMSPEVARHMAAVYAETNRDATPFALTPLYALLHARYINNPDSTPGVHLHLDTGVAPVQPADATIYGNWGGYTVVPPVQNQDGSYSRQDAGAAYQSYMDPTRRGYFHYNNSYVGSGGSCGRGVACSWSQSDVGTAVHEFGHSLTLEHYGSSFYPDDGNCKVSYPSLMSYAKLPTAPCSCPPRADQQDVCPTAAACGGTICQDPAGCVGPPFTVLMFSDGYGRPVYNNSTLSETNAVPNPTADRSQELLQRLHSQYGYQVDMTTGDVDWNRDGIYEASPVPAYSNSYSGSACEFTSDYRVPLHVATLHTPAIARVQSQVFIPYIDTGSQLQLLTSSSNPFHCPPGQDASGCGNTQFQKSPVPPFTESWNQGIVAVAAHTVTSGGSPLMLVVFSDSAGQLWKTTPQPSIPFPPQPPFADPSHISTTHAAVEEISITGGSDHAWLAFKDATGAIWLKKWTNGAWSAETSVLSGPGTPVLAVAPLTSPEIYEAPDGTLYGAFPGPTGAVKVWKRNAGTGYWSDTLYVTTSVSVGKPAMAWRPMPDPSFPGRLYLYWSPRNSDGSPGPLKENWLVHNYATNLPDMSFSMDHSNSWFASHGTAALFDPLVDDDIRLVTSFVGKNPEGDISDGALEVRPKADGFSDLDQHDRNDISAMGVGLCQVLVQVQANPLLCPAGPM